MIFVISRLNYPCRQVFEQIDVSEFGSSVNVAIVSIGSAALLCPSCSFRSEHRPYVRSSSLVQSLSRHFSGLTIGSTIGRVLTMAPSQKVYNVVFVLGPPGSGKGTQCIKIHENLGFMHLSAGDLLRAERQREGSQFGQLIENHIKNGTIVPVEITCKLLENAMDAASDARGFLIDGFPRNQNNLEGWEQQMKGKVDVKFVLFLSCPVDICINRCLNRGQGRTDDNEESLRKRIETYNNQTLPIIQHYEKLGLVKEVPSDKDPEQVYAGVVTAFKSAGF
ncbi:hypothetical protein Y032_0082g1550 [Ancylostoma ceylanicum]|uniref:UMP-CMP kinase n=1 Tax=Ancylostoma ceylanicum TaxID=53326 RepID=A0A016TSK3_9BILA|nr:hypothetical protein Y032_0082g1550 [Ancylostoma ceylanicum]